MRFIVLFVVGGCCWFPCGGCSHMTEKRVVKAFTQSLHDHDVAKLQAQSSSEFEEKAVKGDDTFETLKLIDMPEGRHKVVKVVDKKEDDDKRGKVIEKRVTVEFGDKKTAKKKVWYRLKRDNEQGKWVVDDIYLSRADEKINKSVGNRMEVFHSLLESLEAWKDGQREHILATGTPEFANALSDLSPSHLKRFAKQMTHDVPEQVRIMSQDRIGEETAEMRVARGTQGELEFSFRKVEGHWKVDDLKVESRRPGEGVASARQVTSAMSAALAFQNAYRASDKNRLEKVTTDQFFNGSLAAADLSLVTLPGATDGNEEFDVRLEGNSATFIVNSTPQVMKISLSRQAKGQIHEAPTYLVEDVTIYELNDAQDKRLSGLFTGHATMAAFCAALAEHDLKTLRVNSTHDFNQRVWSRVKPEQLRLLPITEVEPVKPQIVQTDFKGPLTQILVEQGNTPLTYVLRDEGGRMLVDDVLVPTTARPESVKANIELVLPVLEFASSLQHSKMDDVRGVSTEEFQRLAWNYYEQTPDFDRDPLPHLRAPLSAVSQVGDRAVVVLGNERFGAEVRLQKERGQYRIDDVLLVSASENEPKIGLRRVIRTQLVRSREPSAADPLALPLASGRNLGN